MRTFHVMRIFHVMRTFHVTRFEREQQEQSQRGGKSPGRFRKDKCEGWCSVTEAQGGVRPNQEWVVSVPETRRTEGDTAVPGTETPIHFFC